MDIRAGLKLSTKELMLLDCGVGEDSWESLGLQGDPTRASEWKSVLNIHCTDWCWSWNSNTLATWWEELNRLKKPSCWERLKDGGWGHWMASPTQWTWVWVNSGIWWWTGRPGVLWFMGSQRDGPEWVTELSWTEVFLTSSCREDLERDFVSLTRVTRLYQNKLWSGECDTKREQDALTLSRYKPSQWIQILSFLVCKK